MEVHKQSFLSKKLVHDFLFRGDIVGQLIEKDPLACMTKIGWNWTK